MPISMARADQYGTCGIDRHVPISMTLAYHGYTCLSLYLNSLLSLLLHNFLLSLIPSDSISSPRPQIPPPLPLPFSLGLLQLGRREQQWMPASFPTSFRCCCSDCCRDGVCSSMTMTCDWGLCQ